MPLTGRFGHAAIPCKCPCPSSSLTRRGNSSPPPANVYSKLGCPFFGQESDTRGGNWVEQMDQRIAGDDILSGPSWGLYLNGGVFREIGSMVSAVALIGLELP